MTQNSIKAPLQNQIDPTPHMIAGLKKKSNPNTLFTYLKAQPHDAADQSYFLFCLLPAWVLLQVSISMSARSGPFLLDVQRKGSLRIQKI